jgi:hypothetical protein
LPARPRFWETREAREEWEWQDVQTVLPVLVMMALEAE